MANVRLENINKIYETKQILKDINLSINQGELIALLGASGSGKTTILHGIAGINDFNSGTVYFNEQLINDVPVEKRNAALVDQELLLFPHLNVFNNIAFGLKMRKVNKKIINEKVQELIQLVDLVGHEKKFPNELSGGQAQRVAIARALAIEPNVLLLDEPFSKLDIALRRQMQLFVRNLQQQLNMTTVLVTHDKEEALTMADRIAILINGEIKQFGTPVEVYERPNCLEVSKFFGTRNYIEGRVTNGQVITDLGTFATDCSCEDEVTFMFRPEEIMMSDSHVDHVEGIVEQKIYSGEKVMYLIRVNQTLIYCTSSVITHLNVHDKAYMKLNFKNAVYFTK